MESDLKTCWRIYFKAAGIGVRDYLDYLVLPEFSAAGIVVEEGATPWPTYIDQVGAATGMPYVLILDGKPAVREYKRISVPGADDEHNELDVILARVRGEYGRLWAAPSEDECSVLSCFPKDTGEWVARGLEAVKEHTEKKQL